MIEPARLDALDKNSMQLPNGQKNSPNMENIDKEKAFQVQLDRVFLGPLDLLLQLVKEKELEIHVISLSQVSDAYCQYVESLEDINIDEAAEYLVIAATLLNLKSKSLLPGEEVDLEEDLFNPGEELVQQLLEYKELRRVSDNMRDLWDTRQKSYSAGGRWYGAPAPQPIEEENKELDMSDVSIWDLLKVVSRLAEETGFMRPHYVTPKGKSLRAYVEDLWRAASKAGETTFFSLLKQEAIKKQDMPYCLVALLELAKQQQVDIKQLHAFGEINVKYTANRASLNLNNLDNGLEDDHVETNSELGELFGDKPF